MSVKYSIIEMGNPTKPMSPKKFYGKAQIREVADTNKIAGEIAFSTSLTEGDVLNVLRSLVRNMKGHLSDGDQVDLEGFGKFQFQVHSKGSDTRAEFVPANIRKATLQYKPAILMKECFIGLKFEQVGTRKAQKEAKKAAKEVVTTPEKPV